MEFQYTNLAPEAPPTAHFTTESFTYGTYTVGGLAVDREQFGSNVSRNFSLEGSYAFPSVTYIRGTAWISEPLQPGILGTGNVNYDVWVKTTVAGAGVDVWLRHGIFIIDADNNLKYAIQNGGTVATLGTTITNYAGGYNNGSVLDIAFGDRMVFEWWGGILNLSGGPLSVTKTGSITIQYNNNHTTEFDSQSDAPELQVYLPDTFLA